MTVPRYYKVHKTMRRIFVPFSVLTGRKASEAERFYERKFQIRLHNVIERCGGYNHIAKCSGISAETLRRYTHRDGRMPSLYNLFYISSACKVSIDYLTGRETFIEALRCDSWLGPSHELLARKIQEFFRMFVGPGVESSILSLMRCNMPAHCALKLARWIEKRLDLCRAEISGQGK